MIYFPYEPRNDLKRLIGVDSQGGGCLYRGSSSEIPKRQAHQMGITAKPDRHVSFDS